MIYVTVGTMYLDFARLIHEMDAIAEATQEQVIVQTGMGTTLPKHCEHFDFKPREEVLAIQREARVIVTHAGIGSVIDALQAQRPAIFVPRLKRYGEHNNDHQVDIASAMERRGWGRMILDMDELAGACAHPPAVHMDYRPDRERLISTIRTRIERSARAS